ncbi:MAG: hypothetical protein R2861_00685 [Desulfobacterales bacterium]
MIIAGGYNIYPLELDNVLFDHPKILEACTIGVPDTYRGETVKAFIVPKQGETLTEKEIIAYCKKNLAAYKVPKQINSWKNCPKARWADSAKKIKGNGDEQSGRLKRRDQETGFSFHNRIKKRGSLSVISLPRFFKMSQY